MNVEDTMDILCEKCKIFKENKNYRETTNNNPKETVEVFGIHNQEKKLGELNTPRVIQRRGKQ